MTRNERSLLQPKNWSTSQGRNLQIRFEHIEPYLRGKAVLDVGCAVGSRREQWIHGRIAEVASRAVGIDIDKEAVSDLSEQGYNIVHGDAQGFEVDGTFDVVFAGELIEHLDNFRGFLQSVKAHLKEGGLLIITTPNAFRFVNFLYRFGSHVRVNEEHTCWFCDITLTQLLSRHSFSVRHVGYIPHETPSPLRNVVSTAVRKALPDRLAWNTLMVVAEADGAAEDAQRQNGEPATARSSS